MFFVCSLSPVCLPVRARFAPDVTTNLFAVISHLYAEVGNTVPISRVHRIVLRFPFSHGVRSFFCVFPQKSQNRWVLYPNSARRRSFWDLVFDEWIASKKQKFHENQKISVWIILGKKHGAVWLQPTNSWKKTGSRSGCFKIASEHSQ